MPRYFFLSLSFWALMTVAVLVFSLILCDGHFVYALDDPYIHLSVARNILNGTYGVNVSETSSPSSSILWPWLASLILYIKGGPIGLFILNCIFEIMTIYYLCRIVDRYADRVRVVSVLPPGAVAIFLVFCSNAVALPFVGMEHALHVLLMTIALSGLLNVSEGRRAPAAAYVALALIPFVRFEGFAFTSAALLVLLAVRDERLRAGLAVFGVFAGVAAYALYAQRHQLPFVPSSVALKYGAAAPSPHSGVLGAIFAFLASGRLFDEGAVILEGAFLLCLFRLYASTSRAQEALFLLPVSAALLAHILFGPYGWFYRYEDYIIVTAFISVIYILSRPTWTVDINVNRRASYTILYVFCLTLIFPYFIATLRTPFAARSTYLQQYQMGIFVQKYYKQPVAVNDLGLVSYGNDMYVLDLYGLGSEAVRQLKGKGAYNAEAIQKLVELHDVGLAIIYPSWLPEKPENWRPLAILDSSARFGAAAQGRVYFYATDLGNPEAIKARLLEFRDHLPAGATLQIL